MRLGAPPDASAANGSRWRIFRSRGIGSSPLPHPATHRILPLGGRVGERAGDAKRSEYALALYSAPMLGKIVSGGQTGVDRAALDAALAAGLAAGGWCPRGRRAEDGAISDAYPLDETPSAQYRQRTEWNVRDSDATLILVRGAVSGGTALAVQFAHAQGRPHRILRLGRPGALADEPAATLAWIAEHGVATLNVAGPRESQSPGIQAEARAVLDALLAAAA